MMDIAKARYFVTSYPSLLRFACRFSIEKYFGKSSDTTEIIERLTETIVLGSKLEESERHYFRRVIQKYNLSPWALPLSFYRLPNRLERKFIGALSVERLHVARKKLVLEYLPPANRILDVGGGVDIHPEGALLAMGYPHRPAEICIVDLPDGERSQESQGNSLKDNVKDGTSVKYIFSDMSDLRGFEDNAFDLVWSGQSIEHVSEVKGKKVLEEAYRVLRPGGYLCLDTPNRRITKLISDSYLHPDHKIEYLPADLAARAQAAGFTVEEVKSETPLPISARLGRVSKLEILEETSIGSDPDVGFSFYMKCRK